MVNNHSDLWRRKVGTNYLKTKGHKNLCDVNIQETKLYHHHMIADGLHLHFMWLSCGFPSGLFTYEICDVAPGWTTSEQIHAHLDPSVGQMLIKMFLFLVD